MYNSLQKEKVYRNKKILAFARGKECQFNIPGVCNYNSETVVPCHSGLPGDGKGISMKGSDAFVCFGCSSCHDVWDGRVKTKLKKEYLTALFHDGMKRTWTILLNAEILK